MPVGWAATEHVRIGTVCAIIKIETGGEMLKLGQYSKQIAPQMVARQTFFSYGLDKETGYIEVRDTGKHYTSYFRKAFPVNGSRHNTVELISIAELRLAVEPDKSW